VTAASQFLFAQGRQQSLRISVVAEGAAHVHEDIPISRAEKEAGAELEGILPKPMLPVARSPRAATCLGVGAAKEVEQVRRFQAGGLVGGPAGIDQQRKRDAGLLAKPQGIVHVAEPDRRQRSSRCPELLFVPAQLRDMLATEDSAVVPQEDHDRRVLLPQRAEADGAAAGLRQHDLREPGTQRFHHTLPIKAQKGVWKPRRRAGNRPFHWSAR